MAAPAKIDPNSAVYATDEYGRPFIIVREGQKKSRLSGIEAIRVSTLQIIRLQTLCFENEHWETASDIYIFSLIFLQQKLYPTLSELPWDLEVRARWTL